MRNKCPGSGRRVMESDWAVQAVCPECNMTFHVTRRGRLRTYSHYPKAQEAFERRKYRIDRRTGQRVPLKARP